MRLARLLLGLVALPVGGGTLSAQSTPEAAATAFGTAFTSGDWAGAARLMHPAALRQFRDLFSLALTNENLAQAREQLFGFKSTAEASGAPDTVLFAALLKGMLTRQAGYMEAMKTATVTPLGHIQQGDTMLVVVRIGIKVGAVPITQFDVMPFLRDGSVWRGLLKVDITNMAAMLKSLVTPVGG
jgi:hypothetical protein